MICTILNHIEHLPILSLAVTGCVKISGLVTIPIGTRSSATG